VKVYADIAYTEPVPADTQGNLLDLHVPEMPGGRPMPLLIWSSGSAWFGDDGKAGAAEIAEEFNHRGYVVAGVSVRSSPQVEFPAQLYDIRAAIRWLRANADDYRIDPDRIVIMGNSSGGWISAIAATTSDIEQLDGETDVEGVSSAVQAAVPFFPPTDFLAMDSQTLEQKELHDLPYLPIVVHDDPASPESSLIGCPIQTCPDKARAANPITYVSGREPPIFILHGTIDPFLPPGQSRSLYEALRDAGSPAWFALVEGASHLVEAPPPPGDPLADLPGTPVIGAESFTVAMAKANGEERILDRSDLDWDIVDRFICRAFRQAK
jgi:acetyl esterase/lipase